MYVIICNDFQTSLANTETILLTQPSVIPPFKHWRLQLPSSPSENTGLETTGENLHSEVLYFLNKITPRPKKRRSRNHVINDVLPSPVDFLNMADVSSAWIVHGVGHNISIRIVHLRIVFL
jgi:hypothetical protein